MRVSWTLSAAGALFLALLAGLLVLPGRLLTPDHRVQVAVGFVQQPHTRSVQAAPPVVQARPKAPRRAPIRVLVPHPRSAAEHAPDANRLAAVVVTAHRP